jgi:hypothetical protein
MSVVAQNFWPGGSWDYGWWLNWLDAYGANVHFLYDY